MVRDIWVSKKQNWRPLFRGDASIVAVARLFPSEHSARWWFRRHGAEAVRVHAVTRIRGQWCADAERLAALISEIGHRDALEALGLCSEVRRTATQ